MLTDDDKNRITAEEIYREEVRRSLEQAKPPPSKRTRLWTTLNSSFVLWFMSTILVGIISFSYAIWEKTREENRRRDEESRTVEREKRLTTRKLDAEISNRLYYFSQLLEIEKNGLSVKPILALDNPSTAEYPINVFPEFEKRNLQSLLWELIQVVPDNERPHIEKAYEQAKTFSSLSLLERRIKAMVDSEAKPSMFELSGITVEDTMNKSERYANFNLERWGKPLDPIRQSEHSKPLEEQMYKLMKDNPLLPNKRR